MPDPSIQVTDQRTAFEYLGDVYHPNVVDSVRAALLDRPDAVKAAVIERNYIDFDYIAAHQMQGARSFRPVRKDTTRFHFFSAELDEDALSEVTESRAQFLQDHYLGFVVVRNGRPQTLSRSVIIPPPKYGGAQAFFPSRASYRVNLTGFDLEVSGCPYMSQDHGSLACATASIWMATDSVAAKDSRMPAFTTSEITSLAVGVERPYSPIVGRAGLQASQIEYALIRMGYDPRSLNGPSYQSAVDSIAGYGESGLAAILGVFLPESQTWHTVTVIGHTLRTQATVSPAPSAVAATAFTGDVIVHDDQEGMYEVAVMVPASDRNSRVEIPIMIRRFGGRWSYAEVQDVIIPVPSRVLLDYENAAAQARALLEDYGTTAGVVTPDNVVVRPILTHSARFKRNLLRRDDMPTEVRDAYRFLPMPRYVWLVEFAYESNWDVTDADGLSVFGEVILDSTTPPAVSPSVLAVHTPGNVWTLTVEGYEIHEGWLAVTENDGYKPYTIASRP
ncbi:MAG: hypothetical protein HQ478_04715 [Chloroflexi bacterium]|nr:hypothetical protein [Chloroflexota bacterium]